MTYRFALLLAGSFALAAAPAFASPITIDFSHLGATTNQAIGTSQAFSQGAYSVTAYGFVGGNPNDLYLKDTGVDEEGLGLDGVDDNEINPNQVISFNVSNLIAAGISTGTFDLGSLQTDEWAQVCFGSTVDPNAGTCLGPVKSTTGLGSVAVSWASNDWVNFSTYANQPHADGNYLVDSLTFTPPVTTPEPASLFLLATGLAGLLLFAGKRRGLVS